MNAALATVSGVVVEHKATGNDRAKTEATTTWQTADVLGANFGCVDTVQRHASAVASDKVPVVSVGTGCSSCNTSGKVATLPLRVLGRCAPHFPLSIFPEVKNHPAPEIIRLIRINI
jgi:hypothetical protein